LANKIWHTSSFLVNAEEHRYKLIHLFFSDYYSFFSESLSRNNTPVRFLGKRKTLLVSFFQRVMTFLVKGFLKLKITRLPFFEIIKHAGYEQESKPFDLNDGLFLKKAKSKLVLVLGWNFRDPVNQRKYRDLLLETWKPNKKFREKIEEYYNKYKRDNDILVGIHIRRGDYKRFNNGTWYYEIADYLRKMKEIAFLEEFSGKRIGFVICSNETNISFEEGQQFDIFSEARHFIEDLYLLSRCDYIVGPPSTFSMWASFYGSVPLLILRDIKGVVELKQFKIYT
jgi:hypothetical protein